MFEKEAEERARKFAETQVLEDYNGGEELKCTDYNRGEVAGYEKGFVDGAEFAYKKVLDWKYPSKGELPDVEGDYLVAIKNAAQSKEVYLLTYASDYEDEEKLGWYDENGTNFDNEVYAWCKKPEPPKENEE